MHVLAVSYYIYTVILRAQSAAGLMVLLFFNLL